jgi:[acyl-carrier-protein] S-malonyltransferase
MSDESTRQHRKGLALIFPGQGSQHVGMGSDLLMADEKAREILQRADDALGYPLSGIMAGDQGDDIHRTVYTQPAVFVHSMALYEVLKKRYDFKPGVSGGHSLGEYSALCAAGVMSFETCLDLIRVRAKGMDDAQPPGTCGMSAILGLSWERVAELVEAHRADDVLEIANYNAPDQIVVSGRIEALKRLAEALKGEKRAKAVALPVSSAFHTALMASAKETLRNSMGNLVPNTPDFPVVSNVTGKVYVFPDTFRDLLLEQVVRPVRWVDCIRTMKAAGAGVFVELGPGKVLTGLMRRIDRDLSAVSISDIEGIKSFDGVWGHGDR